MRPFPRALALLLAVALLPLLRAFEADPYVALEAAASQVDAVSRPDPDSVVANREDKARRMFRVRDGANERELWQLDDDDEASFVLDDDGEPSALPASILRDRGPPLTRGRNGPDLGSISARGPPV